MPSKDTRKNPNISVGPPMYLQEAYHTILANEGKASTSFRQKTDKGGLTQEAKDDVRARVGDVKYARMTNGEIIQAHVQHLDDTWRSHLGKNWDTAPDALKVQLLDTAYNVGVSAVRWSKLTKKMLDGNWLAAGMETLDAFTIHNPGQPKTSATGLAGRRAKMFNRTVKSLASDIYKAFTQIDGIDRKSAEQTVNTAYKDPYLIKDVYQLPNGKIAYVNSQGKEMWPTKVYPPDKESTTKHLTGKDLQ